MSVKMLQEVSMLGSARPTPRAFTYSIAPAVEAPDAVEPSVISTELEAFLEGDNPLGCFRGVMWVMAFNAAVFLLGFMIWQSVKYL
jgi:hypothetical protein